MSLCLHISFAWSVSHSCSISHTHTHTHTNTHNFPIGIPIWKQNKKNSIMVLDNSSGPLSSSQQNSWKEWSIFWVSISSSLFTYPTHFILAFTPIIPLNQPLSRSPITCTINSVWKKPFASFHFHLPMSVSSSWPC